MEVYEFIKKYKFSYICEASTQELTEAQKIGKGFSFNPCEFDENHKVNDILHDIFKELKKRKEKGEERMYLREKLSLIQQEMKAPKNLNNTFGKYKYRNAEGILEAFKPFEKKYKVLLVLEDNIVVFGDRLFVGAGATLYDIEDSKSETITTTAYAEIGDHKGMSADQITGCASSYARKYALNGLFLLDDTKDSDSDEYKVENDAKASKETKPTKTSSKKQEAKAEELPKEEGPTFEEIMKEKGIPVDFAATFYGLKKYSELNDTQKYTCLKHVDKIAKKYFEQYPKNDEEAKEFN